MKPYRLEFVRLTTAEVATRLRMSVRTVRRLIVRGPLAGIRSGRRYTVELGTLNRFMAGGAA